MNKFFSPSLVIFGLVLIICLMIGGYTAIDMIHRHNVEQALLQRGYSELIIDLDDGDRCSQGYSRGFRGVNGNGLIEVGYVCIFPEGKSIIGIVTEVKE